MGNRRSWNSLVVAVLLSSVAALVFSISVVNVLPGKIVQANPTPTVTVPQPTPSAQPECPVDLPPYNYAAETKDNDFGPTAIFGPVDDPASLRYTSAEFRFRYCGSYGGKGGDPLLKAAHYSVVDGSDPNKQFYEQNWRATLASDMARIRFSEAYLAIQPAGFMYTMYMAEDGRGGFTVRIDHVKHKASMVLVLPVERLDGTVAILTLRLECGFQPIFLRWADVPAALR